MAWHPGQLTRRALLTAASAMSIGGFGRLAQATQQTAPRMVNLPDMDNPESNLETYIKLRGSLGPEPVYEMITGRVFGLTTSEKARLLFKTFGAQRTVYRRVSALEYSAESRYVGLFLDCETEQLLQHWVNPYNQRLCNVPKTHYEMVTSIHPAGMSFDKADETPSSGVRPWFVIGDVFHMVDEIISPTSPAKQPDADLMTFSANLAEMTEPGVAAVPSRLSFTAVEHWRDWMQMEVPGSLWWHVSGAKVPGPESFPDAMKPPVEDESPGFFQDK